MLESNRLLILNDLEKYCRVIVGVVKAKIPRKVDEVVADRKRRSMNQKESFRPILLEYCINTRL